MKLQDIQDIDKLSECVKPINEIYGDAEIFNENTSDTYVELSLPIYKKHKAACEKLFEILDEKPTNAAGILATIATIFVSIKETAELRIFFLGVSANLRSWISAMQSTEDAPQEDLSDM